MNLKEKAKQLKVDIPAVWISLKKKETPTVSKILAWIIVIYALSPIDLIPDFIPIIGLLDDIILLPLLIKIFLKTIPPQVLEECRKEALGLWENGKPKKWYYALPMIVFWLIIVTMLIKVICF